jgi:hypothetical protein
MAKELLKEAIADAKAVREVALQNAKMALEEAFDSKIKNMLSAKLAEEIGEDVLDEDYLDEEMDDSDDVDDVSAATESESFDEEINLDELMAELEEDSYEEGADEEINEEGDDEGDGAKMADLEKLEKALGENSETSGRVNEVALTFIALPSILAAAGGLTAIETALENPKVAAKFPKIVGFVKMLKQIATDLGTNQPRQEGFKKDDEAVEENVDIDALIAEIEREAELEEGATGYDDKVGGKGRTGFDNKPGGKGGTGYDSKKVKQLKEERNAAIATVRSLKGTITEMNLLNSKLLYCNKLFKANSLTEAQKVKVIDALDLASTTNEAKLVFTTLQESFNFTGVEKRSIREGLGRASKASGNAPKKVITESVDGTIARFQKLANIKF